MRLQAVSWEAKGIFYLEELTNQASRTTEITRVCCRIPVPEGHLMFPSTLLADREHIQGHGKHVRRFDADQSSSKSAPRRRVSRPRVNQGREPRPLQGTDGPRTRLLYHGHYGGADPATGSSRTSYTPCSPMSSSSRQTCESCRRRTWPTTSRKAAAAIVVRPRPAGTRFTSSLSCDDALLHLGGFMVHGNPANPATSSFVVMVYESARQVGRRRTKRRLKAREISKSSWTALSRRQGVALQSSCMTRSYRRWEFTQLWPSRWSLQSVGHDPDCGFRLRLPYHRQSTP